MEEHGTWLHFMYKFVPEWVPEPVIVTYFIVLVLAVTARFISSPSRWGRTT